MQSRITSNYGSRSGSNVHGKSVLISFPAHELHLIEELDRLAHLEMTTKSQFLRRCIRREARKVEEQVVERYSVAWNQSRYQTFITRCSLRFPRRPEGNQRQSLKKQSKLLSIARSKGRQTDADHRNGKAIQGTLPAPLLPPNHGHLWADAGCPGPKDPRVINPF